MWFGKKKKEYSLDKEEDVMNFIKNSFKDMHKKILSESTPFDKEQRNILEKSFFINLIEELIEKYSNEVSEGELTKYRMDMLKCLEDCWVELEPDKVVSLIN